MKVNFSNLKQTAQTKAGEIKQQAEIYGKKAYEYAKTEAKKLGGVAQDTFEKSQTFVKNNKKAFGIGSAIVAGVSLVAGAVVAKVKSNIENNKTEENK